LHSVSAFPLQISFLIIFASSFYASSSDIFWRFLRFFGGTLPVWLFSFFVFGSFFTRQVAPCPNGNFNFKHNTTYKSSDPTIILKPILAVHINLRQWLFMRLCITTFWRTYFLVLKHHSI